MKKLPLHVKIMLGLVAGVIWAFVSSYLGWNQFTKDWIDPFGQIFIRMLKYIAVPLVLFSIISGVSSLKDMSQLGRMGGKTLGFYMITTVTAVGVGLLLVNVLQPGKFIDEDSRIKNRLQYERWVAATDGVEILDGKNFLNDPRYGNVEAEEIELDEQTKADLEAKMKVAEQSKGAGPLQFIVDMVPENIVLSLSNQQLMLQVIFFAIFFGITMAMIPEEKVKGLSEFINGSNEVFLKMVDIVMKAAPFFVFALLAGIIAKMADTPGEVIEVFKGLASYSGTLVLGLLFLIFVFYPVIVKLVANMGYRKFFKNMSPAQLMAFSTSSSAATLPVTMECVEDNMGVSKKVASFVLPVGATVNMDGTSLYQAVAVVFLAQMHMVELTAIQQLTIVLTATLASIGSAAVPSAGLIMMILVLQSVGLNPAWVAILFPVDRPLDMLRTVVNVTGDASVSTIIAKTEGELATE